MADAVVITRPLAQAHVLAERIAALGLNGVVFPLLDIHPLEDPEQMDTVLQSLDDYAMVTFVSPNAIDAVLPRIAHWPPSVMIAVVGEGSRRRLAHHGLTEANVRIVSPDATDRMDSESLLHRLDLDYLRHKRVLIVRGESGRDFLSDALRDAGVDVTQLAAYRRSAPEMTALRHQALRELLDTDNEWVVTSSEALRILLQQAEETLGSEGCLKIRKQRIIVSHPRIAEMARELHFTNVHLTASGDDALLNALRIRT